MARRGQRQAVIAGCRRRGRVVRVKFPAQAARFPRALNVEISRMAQGHKS